jgi:hypothetical protein
MIRFQFTFKTGELVLDVTPCIVVGGTVMDLLVEIFASSSPVRPWTNEKRPAVHGFGSATRLDSQPTTAADHAISAGDEPPPETDPGGAWLPAIIALEVPMRAPMRARALLWFGFAETEEAPQINIKWRSRCRPRRAFTCGWRLPPRRTPLPPDRSEARTSITKCGFGTELYRQLSILIQSLWTSMINMSCSESC